MATNDKQYSEMTEEERKTYQEPGAEEGDWMDYLSPLRGLLGMKLLKQAAKQGAKKAASNTLDYGAMKASDKAKQAQGEAQASTWKKPEGMRKWPELEMPESPDKKWLRNYDWMED